MQMVTIIPILNVFIQKYISKIKQTKKMPEFSN